jgi:hypothetical protein
MSIRFIELPKICDWRGNLSFIQFPDQIPFNIKRVFWTYDVQSGAARDGHAYHEQHELIIALSGSFDVVIKNFQSEEKVHLNKPNIGLLIPPLNWRHLENFSTNALAFHISDQLFSVDDYIRDFNLIKHIK